MKKRGFIVIISILATLSMVVGSIQAGTIQKNISPATCLQTKTITYQFSQPSIQGNNEYATIALAEATGYRNIAGEPILPIIMRTIELPFGTTIKDILWQLQQPTIHPAHPEDHTSSTTNTVHHRGSDQTTLGKPRDLHTRPSLPRDMVLLPTHWRTQQTEHPDNVSDHPNQPSAIQPSPIHDTIAGLHHHRHHLSTTISDVFFIHRYL